MTFPLGFAENSIQLVPDGTLLLHVLLILVMVVGTPLLLLAIGVTPWTEDLGELGTLLTSPDDGTLALLVIGPLPKGRERQFGRHARQGGL